MHDPPSDDASPSRVVSHRRVSKRHLCAEGHEPENYQRTWLTINRDSHVSRRVKLMSYIIIIYFCKRKGM